MILWDKLAFDLSLQELTLFIIRNAIRNKNNLLKFDYQAFIQFGNHNKIVLNALFQVHSFGYSEKHITNRFKTNFSLMRNSIWSLFWIIRLIL